MLLTELENSSFIFCFKNYSRAILCDSFVCLASFFCSNFLLVTFIPILWVLSLNNRFELCSFKLFFIALFLWPHGELLHWWEKLGWVGIQCIKSWFDSNFGREFTKEDETLQLKFEWQIDKSWSEILMRSFHKHLEGTTRENLIFQQIFHCISLSCNLQISYY